MNRFELDSFLRRRAFPLVTTLFAVEVALYGLQLGGILGGLSGGPTSLDGSGGLQWALFAISASVPFALLLILGTAIQAYRQHSRGLFASFVGAEVVAFALAFVVRDGFALYLQLGETGSMTLGAWLASLSLLQGISSAVVFFVLLLLALPPWERKSAGEASNGPIPAATTER